MQASTVSPVTNTTANITTKSREQILIQSSGAMIAIIVVGIIIILTVLLIILKTYNRRTHVSRVLGNSSKPRPKTSQSTLQTNMPLTPMGVSSVSGSMSASNPPSENGFALPRAEVGSLNGSSRPPSERGFTLPRREAGSLEGSSRPPSQNGFRLPRTELSSVDENTEHSSAASTVVTFHELAAMENT
ncbi:noncompact myelin-associated protein [Boleophthalmus pectinirostris]|uniref:noncompact myelin-associated protein n=1 Tax=Boleophthalmus pectinirostris TaxID=150288 RepID=UPI000A1C6DDF|nr:noncompact myelin-associated protein [Boleophthalmus pectinirostris]